MEKYYHLCRQHQGKVARITEKTAGFTLAELPVSQTAKSSSHLFINPVWEASDSDFMAAITAAMGMDTERTASVSDLLPV